MKIVSLTAENVKRLTAVEITPTGNMVTISGKNGAGKSSILDAIFWALAGAASHQSEPIRKGATEARIRLDLGEIIVKRTFKRKESTDAETGEVTDDGITTSIVVETAEGARFPSPQKILDDLFGHLTFDPLEFSRMKPSDQVNELRRIANLGDEIDSLDLENSGDYVNRTDINRLAKASRASAASVIVPDGLPSERIDVAALIDQLQWAGSCNADIETHKANRASAAEKIAAERARAKEIMDALPETLNVIKRNAHDDHQEVTRKIEALTKELRDIETALTVDIQTAETETKAKSDEVKRVADELESKLNAAQPLPEAIDIDALRDRIADAEVINHGIDAAAQKATHEAKANEYEMTAKGLTAAMDARSAKKLALIQAAKMPVDGLGLGDGCVLFNGLPFDQASSAEQLRVSVAIAMAANPKLRVLRVKDGSLLDEDSIALLGQMIDQSDFQLWLEKVGDGGPTSFVIEDGQLKGQS
jgi:energy-coupling factor transporter ATP-binding protein EcfA2